MLIKLFDSHFQYIFQMMIIFFVVLNENLMYFQILKVTHASNPILNFVKINCLSDCLLTIIFITYECSIHC